MEMVRHFVMNSMSAKCYEATANLKWARALSLAVLKAPAASPQPDRSAEEHPKGQFSFESRKRQDDQHQPCQPIPDQPPQVS